MSAKQKSLERLKEKIQDQNVKVVSFDVFDTLLVRPCLAPTDLFRIIGMRCGLPPQFFVSIREEGEKLARQQLLGQTEEVTLEEIYQTIASELSFPLEWVQELKKTECEVEKEYLRPQKEMQKLFYFAQEQNKILVLCSDMYLPKDFLEEVLHANGYTGYQKLYISSKEKRSKYTGHLFECMLKDFALQKIRACQIFHIGDNQHSDGYASRACGMQSFVIDSRIQQLAQHSRLQPLMNYNKNSDTTFLLGYGVNSVFDNSFATEETVAISNNGNRNIACLLLGPWLLSVTKWVSEECGKKNIEVLYLNNTDSYLFGKIQELVFSFYPEKIKIVTLRLSQKALFFSALHTENDLLAILSKNPVSPETSVENFLRCKMFLILLSDRAAVCKNIIDLGYKDFSSPVGDLSSQLLVGKVLFPFIKNETAKEIEDLKKSFKSIGKQESFAAVFEVGTQGRFHQFVERELGISNVGYQMFGESTLGQKQLQHYCDVDRTFTSSFYAIGYLWLKEILGEIKHSPEKTDTTFGSFENQKICLLGGIQQETLQYCSGFLRMFRKDFINFEFDGRIFYQIYEKSLSEEVPVNSDNFMMEYWDFESERLSLQQENAGGKIIKKSVNLGNYIESWKKLKKENFKILLKRLHLFGVARKIYRCAQGMEPVLSSNSSRARFMELKWEYALAELEKTPVPEKSILFLGHIASFDKGTCQYLNRLQQRLSPSYDMCLLSETPYLTKAKIQKKISFPVLILPNASFADAYDKNLPLLLTEEQQKQIKNHPAIAFAAKHLRQQFPDMGEGYPQRLAIYFYEYFRKALDHFHPVGVLVWNQFTAMHRLMASLCEEQGIPVVYMEFGVLPGTFCFDAKGQMGESLMAQQRQEFFLEKLSKRDLEKADEVLNYLRETRLNRNQQPREQSFDCLQRRLKSKEPVILYCGQSDFESGLCPDQETRILLHSPIFSNSYEPVLFLSQLAQKNRWNLLVKQHPGMIAMGHIFSSSQSNEYEDVSEMNLHQLLDLADVVVTILSQCSYEALIREKPVVMLGYNQLRFKNCIYQAEEKSQVERKILEALEYGYTSEMREAFQQHVAAMLKYYLYDDEVPRNLRFGKCLDEAACEIQKNLIGGT